MSTILLSLVFTTATAQDWVDESNEHTTVVLKAQSQFQPEGATSLGLTEFDESIMDLGPDLFARTTAVDRKLVAFVTLERALGRLRQQIVWDY